jgi:hypothetical protein
LNIVEIELSALTFHMSEPPDRQFAEVPEKSWRHGRRIATGSKRQSNENLLLPMRLHSLYPTI